MAFRRLGSARDKVVVQTRIGFFWLEMLMALVVGLLAVSTARAVASVPGAPLSFTRDTFAFANETVFVYPHGYAESRQLQPGEKPPDFTLRCFAMCRSVEQFHKFARFDAALPVPDDEKLAALVRWVTHRAVWRAALPSAQRVVIPGYPDLRTLSEARPLTVQRGVGGGWSAYVRPGNYRMFSYWWNGPSEQARTQRTLEATLECDDLFVAYLTTYPSLSINHAVLIYGRRVEAMNQQIRYLVYDPNHPEAPREICYDPRQREFSYQKDWDFVGGKVTVLQVYSHWLQ